MVARRKKATRSKAQREFISEAEEILERLRADLLELDEQRGRGPDGDVAPDLVNRISVRYQLRPLNREQTGHYIDYQLSQAGGDAKLFDDTVKTSIHDFTGGVPRQINNLATACLLQGSVRKVGRIDDELFHQAVGEFQLP